MDRRDFIQFTGLAFLGSLSATQLGCRGRQTAHVLDDSDANMVGSHEAGSETFTPLVNEAVAKLLGRQATTFVPAGYAPDAPPPFKRITFVGIENKSSEPLGDFKDQIEQLIETQIAQAQAFELVSQRFVDAGLRQTRLRPDELIIPSNMRAFTASLEQLGQPFDYMLFATVTSGTTQSNSSYQRDYVLTLELLDIRSGRPDMESATIRKGYHKSALGKIKNYGLN